MDERPQTVEKDYCLGCLSTSLEYRIHDYKIRFAHFWAIFEVGTIKLCYLCKRIAQHAELFIQNVQSNQILLQNCIGDLQTTIDEARISLRLPLTLSYSPSEPINVTEKNKSRDFTPSKARSKNNITSKPKSKESKTTLQPVLVPDRPESNIAIIEDDCLTDLNVTDLEDESGDIENNIKIELKVEEAFDHYEAEFVDENDEFQGSYDVKEEEEDEFPLNLLKKEIQNVEAVEVTNLRRSVRKKKDRIKNERTKIKKLGRKTVELQSNDLLGIKKIFLSKEECLEDRKQQALDPVYMNCSYKCENCLKGFNYKAAYDNHMRRHNEETGEYTCEVCKIRMDKRDTWLSHKKCHFIRWKCTICGLLRTSRSTLLDHHNAVHKQGEGQFACPYCPKTFKRQMSQRKHVRYTHVNKERITCPYCKKSYANKEVIKAHMMAMHPKEVSALEQVKKYPCEECGMMFRSPTHLKMHGYKHSMKRDYYCVECDKGFKSEAALKQHLKTTQIHVNYTELPLSCEQCDKRFAIRRDLDRHINSVHLDVKPFKCDKCDKAYVSNWSLRDHQRTTHEGYKRPLRYPCKFCDKIFDRSSILKAHIRTHTGERPYQCDKCPAQFSQSGVLATHDKLIHQRLTRDGKPKQNAGK